MLQVVRIEVLYDDLSASPSIYLHLESLVLIVRGKGIASNDELLEGDKVSSANKVVLVLHIVIRKIKLN